MSFTKWVCLKSGLCSSAMPVAIARPLIRRLFFPSPTTISPPPTPKLELLANNNFATSTTRARRNKTKANEITSSIAQKKKSRESLVKKRTRSEKEFDEDSFLKLYGNENSSHVPVLLGEVLDVFASLRLRSFVDCTLGAAGHSSAMWRRCGKGRLEEVCGSRRRLDEAEMWPMITVVAETSEMRSGALALTRMITDLGLEVAVDDGVGGLHVLRQGIDGLGWKLWLESSEARGGG